MNLALQLPPSRQRSGLAGHGGGLAFALERRYVAGTAAKPATCDFGSETRLTSVTPALVLPDGDVLRVVSVDEHGSAAHSRFLNGHNGCGKIERVSVNAAMESKREMKL